MDEKDLVSGPKVPDIVDPHHVQTVFVDWIITAGAYDGVINLTLGALDHAFAQTAGDIANAVITARLRVPTPTAERLYNILGGLLNKGGQLAPAPASAPPQNTPLH